VSSPYAYKKTRKWKKGYIPGKGKQILEKNLGEGKYFIYNQESKISDEWKKNFLELFEILMLD
jgi:hypothetical protein